MTGTWYVPYTELMIRGFANPIVARFFYDGTCPAQWKAFEKVAIRKLDMMNAATKLSELRSPPGNHLEALKGDRQGQHSIGINDQFRVCFRWSDSGPYDVEIVDYH